MTTLDELLAQLPPEEPVEVDWNAPEGGLYPPSVPVGDHIFTFRLAETEPFQVVQIQGKPYLQVNYQASTEVDGAERTLNFQRASMFQSDKMKARRMNASMVELVRALGARVEAPVTNAKLIEALQGADAQALRFGASVRWRGYCNHGNPEDRKGAFTVSTQPAKASGDRPAEAPWPRDAEGKFELFVKCPKCGVSVKSNSEINRFKLPATDAAGSNGNATGAGGVSI